MADLDTSDWKELEELIRKEDGAWFLGGEDFLWNEAIQRGLPQLERIIQKKGQYFTHQLKYG
jgi:hypothetical protein